MNKEYLSDNLIEVPSAEELDDIDALLRDFADKETEKVDFEAIKARAVDSARAKKASKKKRMRILSYAAAAACMLFCFGIIGVAVSMLRSNNPGARNGEIDANLRTPDTEKVTPNADSTPHTAGETPEPFSTGLPSEYTRYLYGGKVDSALELSAEAFRGNLPSYMEMELSQAEDSSPNSGFVATANGIDPNGSKKYFDCSIVSEAPYAIAVGDIGSFSMDSDSVFYWRFDEDKFLCARYFGFDSEEAAVLFKALIEDFMAEAKQ